MAFFVVRFWQVAVIVTSAAYLSIWLRFSAFSYTSFTQGFKLKWAMANELGNQLSFWHEDVIFPLALVGVCIFAIFDFVLMQRKET